MSVYPLESNPDVMNKFLHLVGVPEKWKLVDVFGLDGEALMWVPQPVLALILLFPCTDQFYEYAEKESAHIKAKGQVVSPNLFFMKQYVSNACGTIALIHIVANIEKTLNLKDGIFKQLLADAKDLSPEDRGKLLLKSDENIGALNLILAHQEIAMEGQTEINAEVNHHFVALVEKDGDLYELDGRKEFPINHGPTTSDTFLLDAANVCRQFIERNSDNVHFTVMALTASDD